jgi:hypothetical protein
VIKNKILLITSGAYVNSEMSSDFGLIPTSFLPVGHKRLIEHQIEIIKDFKATIIISLPNDFKLLKRDVKLLSENEIYIYRTDSNLSLNKSIVSFINEYEKKHIIEELYILHGDTSFQTIEQKTDLLYYGETNLFYKWGYLKNIIGRTIKTENHKQSVAAGYFTFSNPSFFKEQLSKNNLFETSLINYNKKINFEIRLKKSWLDFGHSNLYFKSKSSLNVARSFNQVIMNLNYITKSSKDINKIKSEYSWFKQLPEDFSIYKPSVWGYEKGQYESSYKIEFIGAPTLQEKLVFGNLPDFSFFNSINQIFSFIEKSRQVTFESPSTEHTLNLLNDLYIEKTKKRILDFSITSGFDLNKKITINNKSYPSLQTFSNQVLQILKEGLMNSKLNKLTLMHGDLCASNIITDNRSGTIKLIDPRGGLDTLFESKNNISGDFRYDVAKLGHSLIGNYDYIVTGYYSLKKLDNGLNFEFSLHHKSKKSLNDFYFFKVKEMNLDIKFINASIVNLFISMLPLHGDDEDRQIALLLNAYKLFYI